jgi:hypothetical protein
MVKPGPRVAIPPTEELISEISFQRYNIYGALNATHSRIHSQLSTGRVATANNKYFVTVPCIGRDPYENSILKFYPSDANGLKECGDRLGF